MKDLLPAAFVAVGLLSGGGHQRKLWLEVLIVSPVCCHPLKRQAGFLDASDGGIKWRVRAVDTTVFVGEREGVDARTGSDVVESLQEDGVKRHEGAVQIGHRTGGQGQGQA